MAVIITVVVFGEAGVLAEVDLAVAEVSVAEVDLAVAEQAEDFR